MKKRERNQGNRGYEFSLSLSITHRHTHTDTQWLDRVLDWASGATAFHLIFFFWNSLLFLGGGDLNLIFCLFVFCVFFSFAMLSRLNDCATHSIRPFLSDDSQKRDRVLFRRPSHHHHHHPKRPTLKQRRINNHLTTSTILHKTTVRKCGQCMALRTNQSHSLNSRRTPPLLFVSNNRDRCRRLRCIETPCHRVCPPRVLYCVPLLDQDFFYVSKTKEASLVCFSFPYTLFYPPRLALDCGLRPPCMFGACPFGFHFPSVS